MRMHIHTYSYEVEGWVVLPSFPDYQVGWLQLLRVDASRSSWPGPVPHLPLRCAAGTLLHQQGTTTVYMYTYK